MARTFGQNQPALVEKEPEQAAPKAAAEAPRPRASRFGLVAVCFAAALALFWLGICAAFLLGYWGVAGLARLNIQTDALIAAAVLLPPFLFVSFVSAPIILFFALRQWKVNPSLAPVGSLGVRLRLGAAAVLSALILLGWGVLALRIATS